MAYANSVGYNSRRKNSIRGYVALLWNGDEQKAGIYATAAEAFKETADKQLIAIDSYCMDENFDLESFLSEHTYSGIFAPDTGYFSIAYRKLINTQIPLVLLNCTAPENTLISSVCGNDLMSAAQAVEYLSSLGHTQIAFIGSESNSTVNAERFAGYHFGLHRSGIPFQYDLTYFGEISERTGIEAAEYFLSKNKRITAFLCVSEQIAEAFIRCMRSAGSAVPEDISVITFDDSRSIENTPLSTASIVQDYKKMGEQAFNALKVSMQGFPAQHIAVNRELIARETTCAPKKRIIPADAD